jgi:hypothetical protein
LGQVDQLRWCVNVFGTRGSRFGPDDIVEFGDRGGDFAIVRGCAPYQPVVAVRKSRRHEGEVQISCLRTQVEQIPAAQRFARAVRRQPLRLLVHADFRAELAQRRRQPVEVLQHR